MATQGRNVSREIEVFRDSFFEKYNKPHIVNLLKDPEELKIQDKLLRISVEKLYETAKKLLNQLESGEIPEEEVIETEKKIARCLYAIEDACKVKVLSRDDCPEIEC